MSKILYHYDPKTGLLISYSTAELDVKASKDNPVYIVPANTTFAKPPVVEQVHRIAKFDIKTNSWTVVDDFRGLPVYNKNTKEKVEWKTLGNLPKEYTFKAPDADLAPYLSWGTTDWIVSDEGRAKLIEDIWTIRKSIREAECSSDIEYNGHMIHVDAVSFNDIMLAAQEALISGDMTTSKRWVAADNVDVQLNGNDFIAIARLFGARRQKLVYESNEAWQNDVETSTEDLIKVFKELKQKRG